jgi:SAM-dependent methyltransferase
MAPTPLTGLIVMTDASTHSLTGPVKIRPNLKISQSDDIRIFLPDSAVNASDKKEFLSNIEFEIGLNGKDAGAILFNDILGKADFIRTYLECVDIIDVDPPSNILELGASHGWASVIMKAKYPSCYVITSDLVPDCIRHSARYEELTQVFVDEKWAFSVRDIPFADDQFDRVFTFAAFHHFGDHCDYEGSLREIARVLKPGGKLTLLYEPSSPAFLYQAAYRRVNRIRAHDQVDEDVIVPKRLAFLGAKLGLSLKAIPFPIVKFRPTFTSAAYYFIISHLKVSHNFLPCTYNYIMTKTNG